MAGPNTAPAQSVVVFERRELEAILRVYGRMVALGHWRDYGLSHERERAVFAVHRRSNEAPLYRVEKRPDLARRQGAYAIVGAGGQVLKRGHDLSHVLRFFDKKRFTVIEGG